MIRRLAESPEARPQHRLAPSSPVRMTFIRLLLAGLAALGVACAGPDKLSRQSLDLLREGKADEAFDKARDALDKQPGYEPARTALVAAATQLRSQGAATMDSLAGLGDSVRAAEAVLAWDTFARQLTPYHAVLAPDTSLARRQKLIRISAAGTYYSRAELAGQDGHPKDAYRAFEKCRRYWPDYRDVADRIQASLDAAMVTLAVLPFANQTDASGLSRSLDEDFFSHLDDGVHSRSFKFTRLLSQEEVQRNVTLSELDQMGRDAAVGIGRRLHVDQVLWGRYYSLSSQDELRDQKYIIYRHEARTNRRGEEKDRYVETPLDLTERERHVSVHYDMEVLDTRTREVLAHRTDVVNDAASIVYSAFEPEGDCGEYSFVPANLATTGSTPQEKMEQRWKARMGGWELTEFLKQLQNDTQRAHYDPADLNEFGAGWNGRPVLLGELPPAGELAELALADAWRPAVKMLQELDSK